MWLGSVARQQGVEGTDERVREVQRAVLYRQEAVRPHEEAVGWREKEMEERQKAVERKKREVREKEKKATKLGSELEDRSKRVEELKEQTENVLLNLVVSARPPLWHLVRIHGLLLFFDLSSFVYWVTRHLRSSFALALLL